MVLLSIRPSTPTWNSHATLLLLTWPSLRNRGTYHIAFQTTSIVSNANNKHGCVSQSKGPPSFMGNDHFLRWNQLPFWGIPPQFQADPNICSNVDVSQNTQMVHIRKRPLGWSLSSLGPRNVGRTRLPLQSEKMARWSNEYHVPIILRFWTTWAFSMVFKACLLGSRIA